MFTCLGRVWAAPAALATHWPAFLEFAPDGGAPLTRWVRPSRYEPVAVVGPRLAALPEVAALRGDVARLLRRAASPGRPCVGELAATVSAAEVDALWDTWRGLCRRELVANAACPAEAARSAAAPYEYAPFEPLPRQAALVRRSPAFACRWVARRLREAAAAVAAGSRSGVPPGILAQAREHATRHAHPYCVRRRWALLPRRPRGQPGSARWRRPLRTRLAVATPRPALPA